MTEQIPRDFLDPRVVGRLAGLPLHARFPMLGSVSGRHRSPVRGSSLEFSSYRKYVPGDDTRRLDWRAYARSDRFYLKEFEADTNLRLCLVMDTSGSMDFGNGTTTKLDCARQLAAALAYLAARQGDAVGLYSAGNSGSIRIPAKRSAAHLRHVLDELGRLSAGGQAMLDVALHEVAELVPQRALIVVLSDLFQPPETLRQALQHLRFRKHDVAVFQLLERNELDFLFDRPTRFVDLEGGPAVLAEPTLIAHQYRQALGQYLQELNVVLRDTLVDYHRICIHEAVEDVLARFLLARMPKGAK